MSYMRTKYITLLFFGIIYLLYPSEFFAQNQNEQRYSSTVKAVSEVMPSVVNIATKARVQRVGYMYDWWRDNWTPYSQELPPQESADRRNTI